MSSLKKWLRKKCEIDVTIRYLEVNTLCELSRNVIRIRNFPPSDLLGACL